MDEAGQDRLMGEAIDLLIRWQNDPGNPVASEMVRAWRARSVEHERMWVRLERVHGASGRVLSDLDRASAARRVRPGRRAFVIGGGLALASLAAGAVFLPDALLRARADFITGKSEVRRIELADGSVATMGPDSAIAVDVAGIDRKVELLSGMGFFEVAPDPRRPFSVASGNLVATVKGTAFEVSNDAGFVTVAVDSGRVEAQAPEIGLSRVTLDAGDWATFQPSSGGIERGRREAGQTALWRDNFIIAERETVTALVARISRWIPGRIVDVHPFLGSARVSGIFDLRDPQRALEAAVHPAGARVRRVSSMLTVISPL